MSRLRRIFLLLFLGLLVGCQNSAPLGEPFTIEADAGSIRVSGTDLEIESCYMGEDFSEDGGSLWFGMNGTRAGEAFEIERYKDPFTFGEYEIEVIAAERFGGCTLVVRMAVE